MPAWLLPDHVSDILPAEAQRIERLRRRLLDLYASYGYAQFQPPMLEYVEALAVQGSKDLDQRSFKMVDPMSGRMLGFRADITPQAARVDAHLLGQSGVCRLCYCASVVHAQPAGLLSNREPIQLGCELFGFDGLQADLEIQELALASLDAAGIAQVHLNLTDRAILLALRASDPAFAAAEQPLLQALAAKDRAALEALSGGLKTQTTQALMALVGLYGPALGPNGVLARARQELPKLEQITQCLDRLTAVAESALFVRHPQCQLTVDLADLQGWDYHNGIMFSIYCPGHPDAVVRGGRYDGMGEAFGRSRPATGFSVELRVLAELSELARPSAESADAPVAAPWQDDADLREAIAHLRDNGRVVVCMPAHDFQVHTGPKLVLVNGLWQVAPAL
ncbi:MAG: hetero-octameric phosphoribosyl transferase, tRNA synthetase-like subunit [Pseudomonadota bacterium]